MPTISPFYEHSFSQVHHSPLNMTKLSRATLPRLLIIRGYPYLQVDFLISNLIFSCIFYSFILTFSFELPQILHILIKCKILSVNNFVNKLTECLFHNCFTILCTRAHTHTHTHTHVFSIIISETDLAVLSATTNHRLNEMVNARSIWLAMSGCSECMVEAME